DNRWAMEFARTADLIEPLMTPAWPSRRAGFLVPGSNPNDAFPDSTQESTAVEMTIWLVAAAWMALALAASLISIRLGISVALVEILIGCFAGNVFHI